MPNRDDDPRPTLRDMLACYALAGVLVHYDHRRSAEVAAAAYSIADAMLAERSKTHADK